MEIRFPPAFPGESDKKAKKELLEAVVAYSRALDAEAELRALDFRIIDLGHRRIAAENRAAIAAWTNLITVPTDTLAYYYKAGVQPDTVANAAAQILGLLGLGLGVGVGVGVAALPSTPFLLRKGESKRVRTPDSDQSSGVRYGRRRIRCPSCEWEPGRADRWMCTCLHSWNTFDTAGVCSSWMPLPCGETSRGRAARRRAASLTQPRTIAPKRVSSNPRRTRPGRRG